MTTASAAPSACPTSISNTGNILDVSYNFNLGAANNGNVMSVTNNIDNLRSQSFAGVYPERSRGNALNRVATAQTTSTYSVAPISTTKCWGESYSYDHWANLLGTALPSSSYTNCSQESPGPGGAASVNNQLATRCYDAAGNLLLNAPCPQPPATLTPAYSYDAENHLVYAGGVNYTYDGDGNRVMKSTGPIYWYGSGDDVLDETDLHGNLTNEYVFFNGARIARRDPSGNAFYYFDDHLGTARSIAEVPSGQTTATLCYDADFYPFGGERWYTDSCDSHYKFTAKERDSESNLDNFGARYSSSALGRWMSPDVINLTNDRLMNPGTTLNKYVYAADNPSKYVDPDGKDITIFYRPPSCTFCTDFGHIYLGALNQATGQTGFLDYYPQNGTDSFGNGPGTFNTGNMQDRAAELAKYASLTIQTTPEEAQKVLDFIKQLTSQPASDYHALSNNCTTVCEDALHDLGLDLHNITPTAFWNALYRSRSKFATQHPILNSLAKALGISAPSQGGRDYGNPRDYGVNFTWLLFQLYLYQNQQQPTFNVRVTVTFN